MFAPATPINPNTAMKATGNRNPKATVETLRIIATNGYLVSAQRLRSSLGCASSALPRARVVGSVIAEASPGQREEHILERGFLTDDRLPKPGRQQILDQLVRTAGSDDLPGVHDGE